MVEYSLKLNSRPFEAIKKGTKKIEGRVPTDSNKHVPFDKLKKQDKIIFTNEETGEKMKVEVMGVRHYKDARKMLEKEGVENVLSSGQDIDGGVKSYNNFKDYKKNMKLFGIYALEIKPI